MNKKLILIIGLILVSLFVLLVALVGVFLFLFISFQPSPTPSRSLLQTQELSVNSKSIHYGRTFYERDLSKEEYVSYKDEQSGNFIVISHFGTNEYKCEGSCLCSEKSVSRRSSPAILTRGLTLFVSAFSTVLAAQIAQEAMNDHCRSEFLDECGDDEDEKFDLHADIGKCVNPEDMVKWAEGKAAKFVCSGYCLPDEWAIEEFSEDYVSIPDDKNIDCESLKMGKTEVTIPDEEVNRIYNTKSDVTELANQEFTVTFLNPYCKEKSPFTFQRTLPGIEEEKYDFTINLCQGYASDTLELWPVNVECEYQEMVDYEPGPGWGEQFPEDDYETKFEKKE